MNSSNIKKKFVFPLPGQRIIKTSIAVFICLMIYVVRGFEGMVSESIITAIICMQPYRKDSSRSALDRAKGTLVGGFWGLLFLGIFYGIPGMESHIDIVYFLIALGAGITLYTAVILKVRDSACLAAIVFVCIVYTFPDIDTPLISAMERVLNVSIGVIVSMLVNNFHLPRDKHPEKVFFVRLEDLVEDRYSQVNSRVLIELNRLYDEGAKISLETKWAPAFLMSQMGFLNINMPIIVMDGAAAYDIRENSFPEIIPISPADTAAVCGFLDKYKIGHSVFTIRDNVMFTYLRGKINEADAEEYRIMKRSPYRNYLQGDFHEEDQVTVIRVLAKESETEHYESLLYPILGSRMRMAVRPLPKFPGWMGIYITNAKALPERMEERILSDMDTNVEPVPVHIRPADDYYIPDHDAPSLLQRLRDQYMPYRGIFNAKEEN